MNKAIKQELRTYSGLIHEENKKAGQDSIKLTWLQNKMFDKRIELDTLMKYISKNYRKYYDLRNTSNVSSIKDIQTALANHEVLIEYALTDNFLFIFVINSDSVHAVKMDIDSNFRSNVENYLKLLRQPPSFDQDPKDLLQEYSNLSFKIYKALIEPIEPYIVSKGLIIIPDDVLGYLPFESLISSAYNKSFNNFRNLPYLLKRFPISYHYSSSLFLNRTTSESNQNKSNVLAMAPIYRNESRLGDSSIFDQMEYLRYTQNEAELIHTYMGGKLFIDSLASETNFKTYASDYSILHLAMHTLLDDEDPMSSKLIFSRPKDSIEDGLLNTYEIYDLKLNAKMVILSACETGSGKLRKGEGIMNMARGFLFAGVPALLITHWNSCEQKATRHIHNPFSFSEFP